MNSTIKAMMRMTQHFHIRIRETDILFEILLEQRLQ
jgi:hypothetical protein